MYSTSVSCTLVTTHTIIAVYNVLVKNKLVYIYGPRT